MFGFLLRFFRYWSTTKKAGGDGNESNPLETAITRSKDLGFIQQDDPTLAVLKKKWTLCNECKKLLVEGVHQYLWLPTLRTARSRRCSFCKAVYQTLDRFDAWGSEAEGLSTDEVGRLCGEADPRLSVQFCGPSIVGLRQQQLRKDMYISIKRDFITQQPLGVTSELKQSLSAEQLSFVRRQFFNCCSNALHDCATKTGPDTNWPRRILKLTDCVTLVDFDREIMAGQYAALSYCWGDKSELEKRPPLKATASTLSSLQAGIPTSDLPLTLQQAICICCYLDIHYIWIDALCILQDSLLDWEIEAKKMEVVYSLSKITIIAASSTSCHSGFLNVDSGSADEKLMTPLRAPLQLVAQQGSGSGFHHEELRYRYETTPVLDPIDRRGWTFQESYLSTRYIKFTRDDIQWKCNAGKTCLCNQPVSRDYEKQYSSQHMDDTIRDRWHSIVSNFARRKFTADTDKLQALSSLARYLEPAFNAEEPTADSKYVGGTWLNGTSPGIDLTWYIVDGNGILPSRYIAPSFSWASLNIEGRIIFGSFKKVRNQTPLSKLIDSGTTPVFVENKFGRLSDGSITLRGPLIPFHDLDVRCPLRILNRAFFDCEADVIQLGNVRRTFRREPDTEESDHDERVEEWNRHDKWVLLLYGDGGFYNGIIVGRFLKNEGYQRFGYVNLTSIVSQSYSGEKNDVGVDFFEKWAKVVTIY